MKEYKFNTIKNPNKNVKKIPKTYSVYMVRLDTPTNALIANILIVI